jgi:hypothetical protein
MGGREKKGEGGERETNYTYTFIFDFPMDPQTTCSQGIRLYITHLSGSHATMELTLLFTFLLSTV